MLRSIKLRGVGPVPELDATLGSRLNVVTGDNGLGKSFWLDACFWALTGSWPNGKTALPAPGEQTKPTITHEIVGKTKTPQKTANFDYHSQTWTRSPGRPSIPGLVIYAAVDGSFSVWDPARNYWRDPASGVSKGAEQPRAYQFTPDTLANGLEDGTRVLCNGLIADWVEWYYQQAHSPQTSPFAHLKAVINLLSHPDEPITCEEPRKVFVDDSRKFPTLGFPYGVVPYPQWSAGVKRVVSLAYLLVWAWVEHEQAAELRHEKPTGQIILIVDEVESHLHPRWQRTILPALLRVVETLRAEIGVQLLTATHSALALASLEPYFDASTDKLFRFDLEHGQVRFTNLPWTIHGDVVGWLTSDIFGLEQARSREAEQAIEAAEAFIRGDPTKLTPQLQTKEQITTTLQKLLPNFDPFWPRWLVEAPA